MCAHDSRAHYVEYIIPQCIVNIHQAVKNV